MNQPNWKLLAKNIPTKIKVGPRTEYEVLWIPDFHGLNRVGETRLAERQIVIKMGMSAKETVKTFYHEVWHAISHEHELNLTEAQVLNIEATLSYVTNLIGVLNK